MFPLGALLPVELVNYLQLKQLVIDICHSVLRGVFERKLPRVIPIMFPLAHQREPREIPIEKSAVVVSDNADRTGLVLNFELVGLVALERQLGQFHQSRRFVGVTEGMFAVAELEDEQAEQHHRLHFEQRYKLQTVGITRSVRSGAPVLVVQIVHGILFVLGLLLVHGVEPVRVYLLFGIRYHLQKLFFASVPFDLGPFPLVDFLTVTLEFLLAAGYLLVQLSLSRLLLLKFPLEGLILSLQFFALLNNTVHSLPYCLHLFFQALRLFLFGDCGLELGFEGLQLLLLSGARGLYQKKQKL